MRWLIAAAVLVQCVVMTHGALECVFAISNFNGSASTFSFPHNTEIWQLDAAGQTSQLQTVMSVNSRGDSFYFPNMTSLILINPTGTRHAAYWLGDVYSVETGAKTNVFNCSVTFMKAQYGPNGNGMVSDANNRLYWINTQNGPHTSYWLMGYNGSTSVMRVFNGTTDNVANYTFILMAGGETLSYLGAAGGNTESWMVTYTTSGKTLNVSVTGHIELADSAVVLGWIVNGGDALLLQYDGASTLTLSAGGDVTQDMTLQTLYTGKLPAGYAMLDAYNDGDQWYILVTHNNFAWDSYVYVLTNDGSSMTTNGPYQFTDKDDFNSVFSLACQMS